MERGDWVVPMLAGEPFLEKPPLFFITASAFARALAESALHDAARLASGFYLSLALSFLAMTARELYGGRHGWTAVLVMLGLLGLIVRRPSADYRPRTPRRYFDGDLRPCLWTPRFDWRWLALAREQRSRFFEGNPGPGLSGWPRSCFQCSLLGDNGYIFGRWRGASGRIARHRRLDNRSLLRSPDLFNTWLITNNFGRFLGFTKIGPHQPHYFYAYTILWYAFPALPWLAGRSGTPFDSKWHTNRTRVQLPLVLFFVMASVLGAAADARELYLMPTLLPLALLAIAGIDRLPSAAAGALATLGIGVFGLLALGLWLGWIALVTGAPTVRAEALAEFQPGFVAHFSWSAFVLALVATMAWATVASPHAVTRSTASLNGRQG